MSEKKFREWWTDGVAIIHEHESYFDEYAYDKIHVIEHSAYTDLQSQLEQANAKLEASAAEIEKWKSEYFNLVKFANEFEAERDRLKVENESLAQSYDEEIRRGDKCFDEAAALKSKCEIYEAALEQILEADNSHESKTWDIANQAILDASKIGEKE